MKKTPLSQNGAGVFPSDLPYTGLAHISTVFLLILPYLMLSNAYVSLGITVLRDVVIILAFNFGIGFLVRQFLGAEI